MNRYARWGCAAGLWLVGCSASRAEGGAEAGVTRELIPIVRSIEEGARNRDPAPIAAVIHPDGVPCGDGTISRAEVLALVQTPGMKLNAFFFDGDTLRRKFKDLEINLSLLEFEQQAKAIEREVREVTRGADGELGTACVRLRAQGIAYMPLLCFFRDKAGWYIASIGRFCR